MTDMRNLTIIDGQEAEMLDDSEMYPDDPYVGPEVHEFDPDPQTNKCRGGWENTRGQWVFCLSTQRSSVLHDDPEAAERARHYHGGGDCMCNEEY